MDSLTLLARAAVRVFVSGSEDPVQIRRALPAHQGGDLVRVSKFYESSSSDDGEDLVWTGPLSEWHAALRAALEPA